MINLKQNQKFKKEYVIDENLTTDHIGIKVLSTPSMIALIEKSSNEFIQKFLDNKHTTVGTFIEFTHEKPLLENDRIIIKGKITTIEGGKIQLDIKVVKKKNKTIISRGKHHRHVVNKDKFINNLKNEK
ncbi:MAG: hypothetical protein FXF47_05295 [Candidatus Mcinerneyibacterium aminivorans]|uniref:Fluoroacetyl-CoA-specific thioesterase-like domain-containing protein n=1 Tax=Candidatus Mcinerneyibacterium aminivorans TaxID=2703815 RepID=A0A5D0MIJ4_9BACT|nr:MAG: hypothetical protein FXF47_05295 [Candidatus Mcinerneyibacterium aminivorans]